MKRLLAILSPLLLVTTQLNTASASLQLVQPDPMTPATFVGHVAYSADGLGQTGTGGTIQADVPAGSSVARAYLYGTYFFNADPSEADRTIDFDGVPVVLTKLPQAAPSSCCGLSSARAEVTAQVAAKIGSGGGTFDFIVNNDPESLNGVALVVLYENPGLPLTTIAVLDGGAQQLGDSATLTFGGPLDKTITGFSATMSLGSGFSFQGEPGHVCGTGSPQSSLVSINGVRLTSCAGNYDDGFGANGALFTVGGVGDNVGNPVDPNQQPADGGLPRVDDDELYDLEPFLAQGDPGLVIETSNPSGDDILFLAVIAITTKATITAEVCDDGIDNDGDGLIDANDSDCEPQPPANNPPVCTLVTQSQHLLWPPNHEFRPVSLSGASDPDGDPVTLTITGVTQDEPVNGLGDGDKSPDAKLGAAPDEVFLRAERSGDDDGRVYRVAFTVTDPAGASCSGVLIVGVLHDQRIGSTAGDSGEIFDSFAS
jgi:hypothetical protein